MGCRTREPRADRRNLTHAWHALDRGEPIMTERTQKTSSILAFAKRPAKPPPVAVKPPESRSVRIGGETAAAPYDVTGRPELDVPSHSGWRMERPRGPAYQDELPIAEAVRFQRILVPVDLSARSVDAARYAASLGRQLGSRLIFVHALQDTWPLREAEKRVRDQVMTFAGGTASTLVIREGAVASVILQVARAERADLVFMPTRGTPALTRLFDRSVTAELLRSAPCPVWADLEEPVARPRTPIQNIVCGLSLGPRSVSVLRWAAAFARLFQANLTIVHASANLESMPAYPCDSEWRHWVHQMACDDMRAVQEAAGTQAEVRLEQGPPREAVPGIAVRLAADLLVIGKSPRRRFLGDLRTLSYDLVCRAPCPVVSV